MWRSFLPPERLLRIVELGFACVLLLALVAWTTFVRWLEQPLAHRLRGLDPAVGVRGVVEFLWHALQRGQIEHHRNHEIGGRGQIETQTDAEDLQQMRRARPDLGVRMQPERNASDQRQAKQHGEQGDDGQEAGRELAAEGAYHQIIIAIALPAQTRRGSDRRATLGFLPRRTSA